MRHQPGKGSWFSWNSTGITSPITRKVDACQDAIIPSQYCQASPADRVPNPPGIERGSYIRYFLIPN